MRSLVALMNRNIARDESGVAYIEFALSVFILSTMLLGMAEVSSYIRVKNKMNQVADQMGNILSTIPTWRPTENVEPFIGAAELIARPFGVFISADFCSKGTGTSYKYEDTYGMADCSLGLKAQATAPLTSSTCDSGSVLQGLDVNDPKHTSGQFYSGQYVVVSASCRYKPYINYFKFFDGVIVSSTSVVPMRYSMQW